MECFIGEIRLFAGNYAPEGWALCNGQILPIAQNEVLFTLFGTTYGGDGSTTFALPNLQSRIPVGQGQAPGMQQYALGATGGMDTVTLTTANLPSHTHAMSVVSAVGTATSPQNNYPAQASGNFTYYAPTNATGFASVDMDPHMITSEGSGQAHDNCMSTTALTYIIALTGVFPSQS
jgi:microcystin-dependent protein